LMPSLMRYQKVIWRQKGEIDVSKADLRKHQEPFTKLDSITIVPDESTGEFELLDSTKQEITKMEPTSDPLEQITHRRTSTESSGSDASSTSTDSSTSVSSTSTSSKKRSKKANVKVHFGKSLIMGVSRPPTAVEHWTLYYWETHAMTCKTCGAATPSTRSKSPFRWRDSKSDTSKLCDEGAELARDVQELEFESENGAAFSHDENESDGEGLTMMIRRGSLNRRGSKSRIRVEVPHNYKYCWRLIKGAEE